MMPPCESGQMPPLTVHFNTVYLLLLYITQEFVLKSEKDLFC